MFKSRWKTICAAVRRQQTKWRWHTQGLYFPVHMPRSHHSAVLFSKFNFTTSLIKTSKPKAAGARSQSYLLHNTSDTGAYWLMRNRQFVKFHLKSTVWGSNLSNYFQGGQQCKELSERERILAPAQGCREITWTGKKLDIIKIPHSSTLSRLW